MGIKRVPTYFNEFACIGGACEDNCCIGWEVDIDDESLEVYKSVGGEFGDRLRGSPPAATAAMCGCMTS